MIEPLPWRIMPGATAWVAKKHVFEVGGDPIIIIIGCHLFPAMPVIARGVVDQDRGVAKFCLKAGKCSLQRIDIAQIAGFEMDLGSVCRQRFDKCLATHFVHVDKADPGALFGEGAGGDLTNA